MKLRRSQFSIPVRNTWLPATQFYAPDVRGLILILQSFTSPFAHDPEEIAVHAFQQAGYATLSLNLMAEGERPELCYNIPTLSERTRCIVEWIRYQPGLATLPLGMFAMGTAPAAAIRIAARIPKRIGAIATLAGRPDLAGAARLHAMKVPICFFVGQDDTHAIILQQAYQFLSGKRSWQAIRGGNPEHMTTSMLANGAALATAWMQACLPPRQQDQTALFPSLAAALSFSRSNLQETTEE